MSKSFYEVMLRRSELLHRRSVWQEVVEHLGKFLDTDAVPASMGIRTEGEGMVVPQDIIATVIGEIKDVNMADLDKGLSAIDRSMVKDAEQKKQAAKKQTAKKKVKRKSGKDKSVRSRSKKD